MTDDDSHRSYGGRRRPPSSVSLTLDDDDDINDGDTLSLEEEDTENEENVTQLPHPPQPSPLLPVPPPVPLPCRPTLLLNLPDYWLVELADVLRHDLVYSHRATFFATKSDGGNSVASFSLPNEIKLTMLQYLDATDLIQLTQVFGGSTILTTKEESKNHNLDQIRLGTSSMGPYQAILTTDVTMLQRCSDNNTVASWVADQYYHDNVSIVMFTTDGDFDLSPLHHRFAGLHLDWTVVACTTRTVDLTLWGRTILSDEVMPYESRQSVEAFFVTGTGELFTTTTNTACGTNYHAISSGTKKKNPRQQRPPAKPSRGSPIVCVIQGDKSISYCGLAQANFLPVSYGAIALRLCYAAQHAKNDDKNDDDDDSHESI